MSDASSEHLHEQVGKEANLFGAEQADGEITGSGEAGEAREISTEAEEAFKEVNDNKGTANSEMQDEERASAEGDDDPTGLDDLEMLDKIDLDDEYTAAMADDDIDFETFARIQRRLNNIITDAATGGATVKKGIIITRAIRVILAKWNDLEDRVTGTDAYEEAAALPVLEKVTEDSGREEMYSLVGKAFGDLIGNADYSTNAVDYIKSGALLVVENLDNALQYEQRKGKAETMKAIIDSLFIIETAAGITVPDAASTPVVSAPAKGTGRSDRDPRGGRRRNLWTNAERSQLLQLYQPDSGFNTHAQRAMELNRRQSSHERTTASVRFEFKSLTTHRTLADAVQLLQSRNGALAGATATARAGVDTDGADQDDSVEAGTAEGDTSGDDME